MSIDVGAQVVIILLAFGPCVVIVNLLGQVCTLGRAPRTKETLPDFHEWCRVTRHSRVFCWLTGCQRTPRFRGVTHRLPHTCLSRMRVKSQFSKQKLFVLENSLPNFDKNIGLPSKANCWITLLNSHSPHPK